METADKVVVELLADVDQAQANITTYARKFDSSMKQVEDAAGRAERAVVVSTGRQANAMRNLGRQIADVGTGLASGQSPFIILAQQAPQVADALADTEGKVASLARFFAGPWGAAILAAGSVLSTILIPKLLESGDAADEAGKKVQSLMARLGQIDLTPLQANIDRMTQLRVELAKLDAQQGQPGTRGDALDRMRRRLEIEKELEQIQGRLDANNVQNAAKARLDATYGGTSRTKTKPKQIDDDAKLAIKSVGELATELSKLNVGDLIKKNAVPSYEDLTGVQVGSIHDLVAPLDERRDQEFKANEAISDDFYSKMDQRVRTIADLYESAMTGANGGIGDTLKRILIHAVAQALAQSTVGGSGGGGFFQALGSSLGSVFGFASGGGGTIGGRPGVDRNLLSLNGRPLARVSRGELLTVAPARAARRQAGTTVLQTIEVDARGAVMNDEFASLILARANQDAARITAQGLKAGDSAMPGRLQRFQSLGT
jgi:hypothetical protein